MGPGSEAGRQSHSSSKHRSSSRHSSVHGETSKKKSTRSSQRGHDDAEIIASSTSGRKSRSSRHGNDDAEVIAGPSSVRKSRPSSRHGNDDAEVIAGPSSGRKSRPSSRHGNDDAEVIAGPSSVRKSRPSSRSSKHGFGDAEVFGGLPSVRKSRSRSRSKSRPRSHSKSRPRYQAAYGEEIAIPEPALSSSRFRSHRSHRSSRHPHDSASAKRSSSARSGSRSKYKDDRRNHYYYYEPIRALGPPYPHEMGVPLERLERTYNQPFPGPEYAERRRKWVSRICCCGCGKWGIFVWITLILLAAILGGVIGHQKNSGGCPVLHDVLFREEEVHGLIQAIGQESVAEGEVGHGFNLKHGFFIPLPDELDQEPVGGERGVNNLNLTVQGVLKRFMKPAGTQPPENFFLKMGPLRLVGGILLMSAVALVLVKVFNMWRERHEDYERIPEQPQENGGICSHRRGLEGEWHACEACSLIEGQR